MRKSSQPLRRIVSIAALILGGGFAQAASSVPPTVERGGTVTIVRDTFGVPHIRSSLEEGGFYGLGYAEADDRLQNLLGAFMWVAGRSAEIMGDPAIPGDIEMRRWRTLEEGRAGFAKLSPQLQRNYRYFLAGVKRFMAEHPDRVPSWAPDLDVETLVAVSRALYWTTYNAVYGPKKCAKANVQLDAPLVVDADDVSGVPAALQASNEWAVLPSRTAHGETILLADPHVEVNNASYYEYGIDAGRLRSAGFAAGPLLWQAHNAHVAWAFTTGNPDMWDCYEVLVDSQAPRQYLYDGKTQFMDVRHEVFRSSSGKTVERDFEYTHHNGVLSPVVARAGDRAYVVSASQMHDAGLFDEEIYRMNRAGSVADLRSSLSTLGMFPQNLMAVDDRGHGYYLRAGKTPRRAPGYDWTAPLPGNSSAAAWRGFLPLHEMVEVIDPAQGYMTNNNVAPDRMFATGNPSASNYLPYAFNDIPGRITTRGVRTLEVLADAHAFSVADAKALAFDEKWTTMELTQAALRRAIEAEPAALASLSPSAHRIVDRVLGFDGFAHADSIAALNAYFWRVEVSAVLDGSEEFAALRHFPWAEELQTSVFSRGLIAAAEAAATAETAAVGDVDQPLGKLFRAGHGGSTWPLGGASIKATPGDDCLWHVSPQCDRTMRAFGFVPVNKQGEALASRGSQATRLLVFYKGVHSWSLYAFGQNATIGQPHSDDQAPLASRREMKSDLFDRAELAQHVESTRTLVIPGSK